MMYKRRDRLEIYCEILKAALRPAKITWIVGQCLLNHQHARKHIDFLLSKNLIRVQAENGLFITTDGGQNFLDCIQFYFEPEAI